MFGFLGRSIGKVTTESVGESLASKRPFIVAHSVKENRFSRYTRGFFDIDNVGTQPQEQAKLNNTFIANDDNPIFSLPLFSLNVAVPSSGYVFSNFYDIPGVSNHRGWQFSTSAALSPTSRRHEFEFYLPETIFAIAFSDNSSSGSQSSTSNSVQGTLDINLHQFPNVELFILNQAFVQTLNFVTNNKLKVFYLIDANGLETINGKLPSTVVSCQINNTNLTTIDDLISTATGIKYFQLGKTASFPSSIGGENSLLSGIVDLSHLVNLTELLISGTHNGVTNYVLPRKFDWLLFHVTNMSTTASGNFSIDYINDVLASTELKLFIFNSNNKLINRNIDNVDISNDLEYFYAYGNQWTGDFIKTNSQTLLKELKLGLTTAENNRFANIDLSGFNGGALTTLHLQGVECENLQLPSSLPALNTLFLYDNKLDVTINVDLIDKINSYTNLLYLHLGDAGTSGQVSTNGLGTNPDFSDLINLQQLYLNHCNIQGTIYLPDLTGLESQPWLYLRQLVVRGNTGLTTISNFSGHATNISTLNIFDCPSLDMDLSGLKNIAFFTASNCGLTHLNLSGITSTAGISSFSIDNSLNLERITFPTSEATCKFNDNIQFNNCPTLTAITNHEFINYGGVNKGFYCNDCALNVEFQIGVNNFLPMNILLEDNGMSTSNVDGTINNIYSNRTKWPTTAKSLNIAGTNAIASGIYQAPTGFILGSNDGTPASAKEQVYVLVNNYEWIVTMN